MKSRREFFKVAGAAALGVVVGSRAAIAQTAPTLVYSRSEDRSNPRPLAGAQLTGTVYIFTDPGGAYTGIYSGARFYLNGAPKRTEDNPPYDFNGGSADIANPFDLDSLPDGSHRIRAELELNGLTVAAVEAGFVVGATATTQPSTTTTQPSTTTTTQPLSPDWKVTFSGRDWLIDGVPLHRGTAIEGLPRNVRLVQAVADFSDRVDNWDASANTRAFISALPTFKDYGIDAITINFQGGNPGGSSSSWGENYDNSAFNNNGSIKSAYADRLTRVLDAMTGLGIVPIVGIFYFRQDQILSNENAVKTAVDNAISFLAPWRTQIVVEAVNEANISLVDHAILKPDRIREVVEMFRDARYHCGFSYNPQRVATVAEAGASDIIFLHGNNRTLSELTSDMNTAKNRFPNTPIAYNEDGATNDSYDASEYIAHLHRAFDAGVGWGYHDSNAFQTVGPVGVSRVKLNWEPSSNRSRAVLQEMKDLT
jgi:hypothetical protein